MPDLPTATVTFLFTDVEGSTTHWESDPTAMSAALRRHDALLRSAIDAHGGIVFKTVGDAFCAAFPTAPAALAASMSAQRALSDESWPDDMSIRVRIGLHAGAAEARDGDYFGPTLNRVARLMSAGHGGQTLLSAAAWELVRDDLPDGVTLRDLGERRLKDLRRPERIYQVLAPGLPADFPPLATLDARPNNLPVQLTSFVGREREMAEVKRLLKTSHLVTLTGIGGTGKTRLALQAAADLIDDFDHGVWFVDLSPLIDPSLVASTVASVLGIRDEAGRTIEESVAVGLRSKRMLIALDNCEHVVAASAALADRILRVAADVRILATSREALAIAGEAVLAVAPLEVPAPPAEAEGRRMTAASLTQYDAVRLFIDRAVAVDSNFVVTNANAPAVAGICQRLDGIPLALELAAARVRMIPPEAILERLTDRFRLLTTGSRTAPTRQQTLLAAVDWSYDLLEASEKVLLRRLATFRGGWTLEAAESVCSGDGVAVGDVLDLMGRLVEKSLVIPADADGAARYHWLETVRQYATQRLESGGEWPGVVRTHAKHFMTVAESTAARFDSGDTGALAWFDIEHDNLRAVLDRTVDDHSARDVALRTAMAVKDHWWWHCHNREGCAWCQRLLSMKDLDPHERATLQYMAGGLSLGLGQVDECADLVKAALDGFLVAGDLRRAAWCHNDLGLCHSFRREYDQARAHFAERLALTPDDAPDWDRAVGFINMGEAEWYLQDFDAARSWWEAARDLMERSAETTGGPHVAVVDAVKGLGHLARQGGDLAAARRLYHLGLQVARSNQSPIYMMRSLICVAVVAAVAGDASRAGRLLGAAEACSRKHSFPFDPMDQDVFDEAAAASLTALGDAPWQAAYAEGQAMGLEAAVEEALAFAIGDAGPDSRGEPPGTLS